MRYASLTGWYITYVPIHRYETSTFVPCTFLHYNGGRGAGKHRKALIRPIDKKRLSSCKNDYR